MVEVRNRKGLSSKEVASILGVSASYYYKIEEQSRNPSYNFLKKYKAAFDVCLDDIFFNSNIQ